MAEAISAKPGEEFKRRLRELREPRHGGYVIHSHYDRKDLKQGEYVFPRQERKPRVKTPRVTGRVRAEVLFRDAYTCQSCGLYRGELYEDGTSVKLQVAHNVADSHGGKPDVDNCFTQCNRCNVGESNVGPDRPSPSKTLAQVKRLPDHQKREILAFLEHLFRRK